MTGNALVYDVSDAPRAVREKGAQLSYGLMPSGSPGNLRVEMPTPATLCRFAAWT
jgi:hypothetical protein